MRFSTIKLASFFSAILLSAPAFADQTAALAVCSSAYGYVRLECKGPTGIHEIKSGPVERAVLNYPQLKEMAGAQTILPCNILVDGVYLTDFKTVAGGSLVFDLSTSGVVAVKNQQFITPINSFTDLNGHPITGVFSFLPPPNNAVSYSDSTCPFKKLN